MKGFVDDGLRALLRVPVSASRDGRRTEVEVWIDTAFNGGLAIPRKCRVARPEVLRRACRSVTELAPCSRQDRKVSWPACESLIQKPAGATSKNAVYVTTSPASRAT